MKTPLPQTPPPPLLIPHHPRLDIPPIILRNHLLPQIRRLQHRLLMRPEPIEPPIKHAGDDKGVNIPNRKQMLTPDRYRRRRTPGPLDIIHEPRERRDAPDEKRRHRPPVGAEPRRVPVHAVEIVHVGHRDFSLSHDKVIRHEDRRHGSQEDGVAAEEGEEFRGGREDFPGDERPAAEHRGEDLAPADVDVFRAKGHQVVGGADAIGGDVDAERHDDEADGGKGGGCATPGGARGHPEGDDFDGVPHDLAVGRLCGGGGEDAEETDDGWGNVVRR